MSHTVESVKHDVEILKVKIDGDGNGNKGLMRKHDAVDLKLNAIIALLMVVLATIVAKWAESKAVAPSQTVSQSISVDDGAPKPGTYTTAQLAAKMQLSTREIQDRAAKGEIPGAWKDGKSWRFDQPSIDSWLAASAADAVKDAKAAKADR